MFIHEYTAGNTMTFCSLCKFVAYNLPLEPHQPGYDTACTHTPLSSETDHLNMVSIACRRSIRMIRTPFRPRPRLRRSIALSSPRSSLSSTLAMTDARRAPPHSRQQKLPSLPSLRSVHAWRSSCASASGLTRTANVNSVLTHWAESWPRL
jgi:hypothetical protein